VSNHIPLAIRWPKGIASNRRTVSDYVNFTDLAPTFLQAAGVKKIAPIMQPMSGRSLFDIFASNKSGQVIAARDHVLLGKERHDIGRPGNTGYPIRGILKDGQLYLHNFKPDRWPACNPETGYLNCDASPTKTLLLNQRRAGDYRFWRLNFGKRPVEELFNVKTDPDCVKNLAETPAQAKMKAALKAQLFAELKAQGDPRMFGRGDVFDKYPYSGKSTDNFYRRYMAGEKVRAGWVLPSDFEKEKLD
jgi:arylsulfatase A-like enzyme